jgi:hypothetical protein
MYTDNVMKGHIMNTTEHYDINIYKTLCNSQNNKRMIIITISTEQLCNTYIVTRIKECTAVEAGSTG